MITIKLFAAMAEEADEETIKLPWTEGMSTADVKRWLEERYPMLAPHIPSAMVAINQEFANIEEMLRDGDEVAFLPPVSGG
ncbi:MoaD/ThiS family protein [Aneurinibacillus aneurinilyticus]|uniref:MoaD/ThiS family protein n=1 Tax=Aneurinibacillus aneurinilyticus TaxID=1391 RepID=UPI002E1C796C|nr:MoaD/ThiS family protein [Aneurinibacillus aneurinilyticus]